MDEQEKTKPRWMRIETIDNRTTSDNVRKVYYIFVAGRGGAKTNTYARNIRRQSERNNTPVAQ